MRLQRGKERGVLERLQPSWDGELRAGLVRSRDEGLQVSLKGNQKSCRAGGEVLPKHLRRVALYWENVRVELFKAAVNTGNALLCSEPRHACSSCLRTVWSRDV